MDRANALAHMQVVRGPTNPRGIHWFSREHASALSPLLSGYEGHPSINRRFKWLLDTFELWNKADLKQLLEPVLQRRLIQSQPAFCTLCEEDRPRLFPASFL